MTLTRNLAAVASALTLLCATALPSLAQTPTQTPTQPPAQTPKQTPASPASAVSGSADAGTSAVRTRRFRFIEMENQPVLRLRTTQGSATINFGARVDEVITKASLKIRYAYSPALIPAQSHIKVLLNEEIVGILPVTKEDAGRQVTRDVEIDPRFIADFNKLRLEFIGHYTNSCEDPLNSSLWADVSGASELELTARKVELKSDLAALPEPFFDRREYGRLKLPYVFAAKPGKDALRAAAVTASWFGELAGWRGARFPAHLDKLPAGHAVVFATNDERPAFLNTLSDPLPSFTGPGLTMLTNPADGYSKLLLVSGRNGEDLKIAADALVRGTAALSGAHADVVGSKAELPRKAYDAPNWVRLDRPMKFGELVESPQQLQVFGHVPDLVRINMRIPPDLFTWRSRGVPVDLKFRYTPPLRASESRLSMSINDELVQAMNLRSSGQGGESSRVVLPLLDDGLLGDGQEVLIPAFKLGSRNQLQYAFSFTYFKEGDCRDTQVENVRAMIDADSKIDFSGYPHYAQMPHLGYFSTAGFPFTKYADLAQTTVVMPRSPGVHDIETMLTLLGRMGESTGYPATRVTIAGPDDEALMKDRDLLLIGASAQQSLLDKWGPKLPAVIANGSVRISQPARAASFLYDWFGFGTNPDTEVATQEHIKGSGPIGAMLGFESPLTPGRSVVAVTATEPAHMGQVLDILDDTVQAKSIHGSAVFVKAGKQESILAGPTYTIGKLPFWTAIWFPLSAHPILLGILGVLAVLVFAFALWRTLKAVADRRLNGDR